MIQTNFWDVCRSASHSNMWSNSRCCNWVVFQVQNPSWLPHQTYIMQHPVRTSSPGFWKQTESVVCTEDLYQTVEMSASERHREGFRGEAENKIFLTLNTSLPRFAATTSIQYLPSVVAIRCDAGGYSARMFNFNPACCLILTAFTQFLDTIFYNYFLKCILILLNSAIFLQGTVISPSMDPSMSLQPTSMMAPLAQQMSHLSLGSAGTVRTS